MANRNLPEISKNKNVWNPLREIKQLQRGIDQIFEDFTTMPSFFRPSRSFMDMEQEAFTPPCDIEESNNQYLVSFDIPGMKKEDVKIEVTDNQLIVSGERKEERKEEKANRITEERFHGTFMRSFTLPANVKSDQVEASYENGILKIAIPKTEVSKPKQISIKEGKLLERKAA